jgi:hypothetical protein
MRTCGCQIAILIFIEFEAVKEKPNIENLIGEKLLIYKAKERQKKTNIESRARNPLS